MLELAGEVGEGLIINFMPVEAMPKILGAYRAGAQRAGRDASSDEVVARFQVCITDDVASARKLVRLGFGGYVATPVYNRFFEWVGFGDVAKGVKKGFATKDREATAAAMTDDFIDRVAILGTAEECREKLAAFVEAGRYAIKNRTKRQCRKLRIMARVCQHCINGCQKNGAAFGLIKLASGFHCKKPISFGHQPQGLPDDIENANAKCTKNDAI